MNYYCISYRLRDDPKGSKRYWEDSANSYDEALSLLSDYVVSTFYDGVPELFGVSFTVLKCDEYLSIFK